MSDVKQVKVDNWGIYFLQRLKHFFNRTDYCDLTLQFQDNAQLKVHRLVLNACTEYFELLERTCEMYEDCLVMPDDLQADVVVPIVNFMYTGHLEFRPDLLERLYQTSQILNMPVLSKLLESHRLQVPSKAPTHSYSATKRYTKQSEPRTSKATPTSTASSHKRSYSKAFDNSIVYKDKKTYQALSKTDAGNNSSYRPPSPISVEPFVTRKSALNDPRPTRYELPEELDTDNVFDNSFCNISYTSQPLMVHPDTIKRYKAKRSNVFGETSGTKKLSVLSTVDIVECKKISKEDSLFDDSNPDHSFNNESDLFNASYIESEKDTNQLFDQILDPNDGSSGPKVTIETKDSKAASNLDHARIISEVLKKYPHLVKSNKNIKLILDPLPGKSKRQPKVSPAPVYAEEKPTKLKREVEDLTYETDIIDSKQAAQLIAMGAENTKGPWICLICGTPGKALHFNSYYKFRRHLVEVHNEKPVSNICEYCGLRSLKRNYLLHHLYAQHGVQPPPQYHFPKCNLCSYIALTEGLLVKHKLGHKEDIKNFRCNVCSAAFSSSSLLLIHIQNTGHKYSAGKKANLQCIYCLKVFLRETNLYAHIKTHHKIEAKTDCIIDDSDEEMPVVEERPRGKSVKFEPSTSYDNDYELEVDLQYPIQQRSLVEKPAPPKKQINISNQKQKILNPGFGTPKLVQKAKPSNSMSPSVHNDFFQDIKIPIDPLSNNNQEEEIVVIDNNEYIMRDNQLIPKNRKSSNTDFIIPDMVNTSLETLQQPTTSVEYANIQNMDIAENVQQQSSMILKKTANLNQPIQIVVSNEEEYKALMASNHPIIFDNGESNKTLTVLSTPHHNQDIETRTIDLDSTQSNEMMILPNEYHSSLNVSEAVTTENPNIVVVYSHPVDDQNKQFQIITTGGAQFVQSSAIITQNFETVTTSTPTMNAHCIGTQVDQNWQNNVQSLDGQEIQLPPHAVIEDVDSSQVVIKPILSETGNNLDELPEVHLRPEIEKELPPSETDITHDQSNITIEHINETVEHTVAEEQTNVTELNLIVNETSNVTDNETVEAITQTKSMPEINTTENIQEQMEIENVLEQPMETENIMEQPMETDNIIEQQIETETVAEHPVESEDSVEQTMVTEGVLEQPRRAENVNEQPVNVDIGIEQQIMTATVAEEPAESENMIVHPMETENVLQEQINKENTAEQSVVFENIEKPEELDNFVEDPVKLGHIEEQPIETECTTEQFTSNQNEVTLNQEHLAETITEYSEVEKSDNPSLSVDQQPELIASQSYDDIVEINRNIDVQQEKETELVESQAYDEIIDINNANNEEPINVKEAEVKIQSLTSEWSEDEYDVAEDQGSKIAEMASNSLPQPQPNEDVPELEESIENIQQEVQKQIQMPQIQAEPDCETEESAISSQEEDSSSQEMQLPPLIETPILDNPQAQQKISSLLNDWEDNDSQEEINTISENTDPKTAEQPTDELCLSENSGEVPKNDNIKSLVSDWDDEEEEIKE